MEGQTDSERSKVLTRVIAKAWADTEYKKRLLNNPAAVLKEEGVNVPADVEIQVVADTENTRTLVIPPPPKGDMAVQEVEERIAAGGLFVGMPM